MTSLLDFIRQHVGQHVTSPGGQGGQCVDLVELWLLDQGLPLVGGNATDLWAEAPALDYIHILNGPTNAPRAGDVVIWHRAPAVGIGPYGHTAVALLADSDRLLTLDQNWPEKAVTGYVLHPYIGVTGWLRGVPAPVAKAAISPA